MSNQSNGYLPGGRVDVAYWKRQIRLGVEYRRKCAKEVRWDEWRKMYRGEWRPGILPSNLFFRMARTIVPRIYFRNPSVSVTPKKPGMLYWAFAQLLERIDQKMLRGMRVKQESKRIVQNTFFFGTGIGKLGFGAELTPTPEMFGTWAPDSKRKGQKLEYKSNISANMPWFSSVHPGNFIVPAGCPSLNDARWVAEWHRRTVSDMLDDPRFKNVQDLATREGMFGDPEYPKEGKNWRESDPMMDFVEIHDKKTGKVFVIAPYSKADKTLLIADDELQINGGLNYYEVVFNPDDEYFWGVPDSQILEPQQLELNEIRTQQMKHRRLSLIRILAKRMGIKEDEAAKMVDEKVSPVVWTEGDPNTTVRFVEGASIPDGLIEMEQIIMQDMREMMGFSRQEFGETSPANARTSAEETRIVKAATEIRVDERRDMLADMLVRFIEDMHHVIFNNWSDTIVLDVVGPMGVPLWVKFRPEVLKSGLYDVQVDPDTSIPETKDVRQQKAIVTYQLLSPNPLIDPVRLTRYLLHELHGVQFDDMLRGMPPGLGGPGDPMDIEQYIQLVQQISAAVPQALTAGPPAAQPIEPTLFE